MNIVYTQVGINEIEVDLLALACYQEKDNYTEDRYLGGLDPDLVHLLKEIAVEEKFLGKSEQSLVVHTHHKIKPKRLILLGMGKTSEIDYSDGRLFSARVIKAARKLRAQRIALCIPSFMQTDMKRAIQDLIEGALIGNYSFDKYKSDKEEEAFVITSITFVSQQVGIDEDDFTRSRSLGLATAEAVIYARDLANEPACVMTPALLAQRAEEIARENHFQYKILDETGIDKENMRLVQAVSRGSSVPPRFIHLTYTPPEEIKPEKSIALVGKGVTFDSGGISIKPASGMEEMKLDMSGAAAVLATMKTLTRITPRHVVHGIIPAAENMPGSSAYRPGDVFIGRSGKSVEIINTDAEGRLLLADALSYACDLGVDYIIDLATLTGACVVALGTHTAGAFGMDDKFMDSLLKASKDSGEDVWRMPLVKQLKPQLKSEFADIKNLGDRWGGAITGALFLQEFVKENIAWIHLDIAGPAINEKEEPLRCKGGTGFGTLLLLRLIQSYL